MCVVIVFYLFFKKEGSLMASERKVVLYVITGLHTGGAERMLVQLLKGLDQQWAPVVISLSDGSGPEDSIRSLGIPVHSLGLRTGRLPGPAAAMKLIRLVRRIRPDLIQGWMYHGNLAAQFANFFLPRRRREGKRVPLIWGIHHSIGFAEGQRRRRAKRNDTENDPPGREFVGTAAKDRVCVGGEQGAAYCPGLPCGAGGGHPQWRRP